MKKIHKSKVVLSRSRCEKFARELKGDLPVFLLPGQFFHSLNKATGKIEWQGYVIGSPEPGYYYIQLFNWIDGDNSVRRIVTFSEMIPWLFYDTAEDMQFSYEGGTARRGGPYSDV